MIHLDIAGADRLAVMELEAGAEAEGRLGAGRFSVPGGAAEQDFAAAVTAARLHAYTIRPESSTWAAYQCYGDPEWTWRREGVDAQRPTQPLSDELAGVASPVSLTLALETLAIQGELGGRAPAYLLDRLRFLESEFAPLWGAMGAAAESFGLAYAAAEDKQKAIAWYQAALAAPDRSASPRPSCAGHTTRAPSSAPCAPRWAVRSACAPSSPSARTA